MTNICVIHAKQKQWDAVVKFADEALLVDDKYVKALFHRGRALLELTEYQNSIDSLAKAAEVEPENADVMKELARA